MTLLNSWKHKFPSDATFMAHERSDEKQSKKCRLKGESCQLFRFRPEKENPSHLIDFADFLKFILERDPTKVDPHFRKSLIFH